MFARRFFLKKLRSPGGICELNDLPSLDPQLFQSLLFLRSYRDGDVADLGLTFSLEVDALGATREVELVPGGKEVPVTADNVLRYVHLAAHFYLNAQIAAQVSVSV